MKTKTSKRIFTIVILFMFIVIFASCANKGNVPNVPYGFFSGIIHGILAPLAFIGNILGGNFAIYAVHNCGNWYDFGYLLGIGGFTISFSSGHSKTKKNKNYAKE